MNDPVGELEKELATMGVENKWPGLRDAIIKLAQPRRITVQRHPLTGRVTHADIE